MYAEAQGGAGAGRTRQTSWTVFAHVTGLAGRLACSLDGRVFPGGQEAGSSNLPSPTRNRRSEAICGTRPGRSAGRRPPKVLLGATKLASMRGMGGHVKRRGSRWVAIIELEPDPASGRRRQRQGGSFPTKRAAQEALAEMVTGQRSAPVNVTLGEFLEEEWLPSRSHRAAATRQQYAWAVRRLVQRMGKAKLSRVTPRMVQDFLASLNGEGLSTTSIQLVGKVLRMALGDAVKRGLIPRNPALVVALPGGRRSEIECSSRDEVLAFLDSEGVRSDRLRAVWRLALATGLRRGELVALRWRDLDFAGKRLFVRQAASLDGYRITFGPPKTQASVRTVALDDDTLAALEAWRTEQGAELRLVGAKTELVVTQADGSPVHPQTLARLWDRLVRRTDLPVITLHGSRHSHATLLLHAGVPSRSSPSGWAIRRFRSPPIRISTCWITCSMKPPRGLARSSVGDAVQLSRGWASTGGSVADRQAARLRLNV